MPASRFQLNDPRPLPSQAEGWRGLAAAYDVNGDAIDDLVFHEAMGTGERFRLLVSNVTELPIAVRDCPTLEALPTGRLFLRDLNGDEVPDFVIATRTGLEVFHNLERGFEPVFSFDWPDSVWSVLELGSGDFDGDGRVDFAAGYDRWSEPTGALGIMAFLQTTTGSFEEGRSWEGTFGANLGELPPLPSGDLAVGRFTGGPAFELFAPPLLSPESADPSHLGDLHAGATLDLVEELLFPAQRDPSLPALRSFVHPGSDDDPRDVLAVVTERTIELFQISAGSAAGDSVTAFDTVFEHRAVTHELGGGSELPRQWFIDLDRSGDPPDAIEMSFEPPWQLAIHSRYDFGRFDPPQVFDGDARTNAESPFIRVGPISAVVLDDQGEAPTLRTLTPLR